MLQTHFFHEESFIETLIFVFVYACIPTVQKIKKFLCYFHNLNCCVQERAYLCNVEELYLSYLHCPVLAGKCYDSNLN
jgi:hypothetical protein